MTAPIVIPYINRDGDAGTVLGFPTGVPGLVVNEADYRCDENVCYLVTHARSGHALPYCWESPEGALAYAHDLAGLIDWTRPRPEIVKALLGRAEVAHKALRRGGTHHQLTIAKGPGHDNGVIA